MKAPLLIGGFVLALLISYFEFVFLEFSNFVLVVMLVLTYLAILSFGGFMSTVLDTLRLLKEKPPLADRAELVKARIRKQKEVRRPGEVKVAKEKISEILESGKDPMNVGISDIFGEGKSVKPEGKTEKGKGKK